MQNTYNFDVTNEELVTSTIKNIGEKYGKIDVLVNNAGGLGGRSRFEEMTTEFYRNVMALNLDSVVFCFSGSNSVSQKRRPSFYNKLYI